MADGKYVFDIIFKSDTSKKVFKGVGVGLAGLGIAAVAVGGKAISMASDFDQGMRKVDTLLDENEQNALDWEQVYKDIATDYGLSLEEVTNATYSALSASADYNEVQELLASSSELAIGGFTDLESALDVTTSVLNAYNLETSEAQRIQDILITTQNQGKTTVDELASSLSAVTPTASALGISFEDVGAGLATITAQGTPTAQATTQLNSLFAEMGKEGTKASDMFKEIAGVSFNEYIEGGGNVGEAMVMMQDHADATGMGMLDMFSSIDAGKAALQIAAADGEMYAENLDAMHDSAGATNEAFDTMAEDSLPMLQAQFASSMEVMMVEAGQKFMPIMIELFDVIQDLVPIVAEFVDELLVGLAPVLDMVIEILPDLVELFMELLDPLTDLIMALLPPVLSLLETLIPIIVKVVEALTPLIVIIVELIATILELIMDALEPLMPVFNVLVDYVLDQVMNLVAGIAKEIELWIDIFKNLINFVVAVFTGDWETAWESVKNIFTNILEIMKNRLHTFGNFVINRINLIIRGLNLIPGIEIALLPLLGQAEDVELKESQAKSGGGVALAEGGLVHGETLALVGDNPGVSFDPEVVAPLSKLEAMLQPKTPFNATHIENLYVEVNKEDSVDEIVDKIEERLGDKL